MKVYRKLIYINNETKKEINLPIGRNILMLFFAPIILIYKKQYLFFFFSIITFFIANIYFYFQFNHLLIKKHIKKGWIFIDDLDDNI